MLGDTGKNGAVPDFQMCFTGGNVEVLDRVLIGFSAHWVRRLKELGYISYRDSNCHWRGCRVTNVSI